jgi:hypothetical protein
MQSRFRVVCRRIVRRPGGREWQTGSIRGHRMTQMNTDNFVSDESVEFKRMVFSPSVSICVDLWPGCPGRFSTTDFPDKTWIQNRKKKSFFPSVPIRPHPWLHAFRGLLPHRVGQTNARNGSDRPFSCKPFKMNLLCKNRLLISPGESDRIKPIWLRVTLTRGSLGHAPAMDFSLRSLCSLWLKPPGLIRPQKIKVIQGCSSSIKANQGVFETFLFWRKSRLIKSKILKMPKMPKSVQCRLRLICRPRCIAAEQIRHDSGA